MEEELELDLNEGQHINKTEERIKNLSSKVKDTSRERDEANAKAQSEAEARVAVEKERDFYASFSDQTSKYPGASEHKDAIKEKVMAGYSVEDATVAVLAKEGKYTPQVEQAPAPANAAGGSASFQLPSGSSKTLGEMSRDEKRAELEAAIGRGDIYLS